MTRRRRLHLAAALAVLVVVAGVGLPDATVRDARGGVVVLKNGEVLVGRIRAEEIDAEAVTVRWPYKDRTDRGQLEIPRFRIRWFDAEADAPTDEYWARHADETIDERFHHARAMWQIRNMGVEKPADEEPAIDPKLLAPDEGPDAPTLSVTPFLGEGYVINAPSGWTTTYEDEVAVFEAPGEVGGYRPRIQTFSLPSAGVEIDEQRRWLLEELAAAAGPDERFEVRASSPLHERSGGVDLIIETLTERDGRRIAALRVVLFRERRTYLFTAYAAESAFESRRPLFEAVRRTFGPIDEGGK